MKLTYEQKVQIYHDWKSNRMSASELAKHNKNQYSQWRERCSKSID